MIIYHMVRLELETKRGLKLLFIPLDINYLHSPKDNPDLHPVKLNMYNAFNEVQQASFLQQLEHHFSRIYPRGSNAYTFLEYTLMRIVTNLKEGQPSASQ